MRTFLAIDVEEPEIHASIHMLQQQLLATGVDAKSIEPPNLHFTIRFFGEISPSQAEQIAQRLTDLRPRVVAAELLDLGVFPSPARINVVWLGVDPAAATALRQVADAVAKRLSDLPLVSDKRFEPHLTILRVRTGRNKEALWSRVQAGSPSIGVARLRALKLKKSDLTPTGPIYSDLHVFAFEEG
jgi:2'-5' RNA ligase